MLKNLKVWIDVLSIEKYIYHDDESVALLEIIDDDHEKEEDALTRIGVDIDDHEKEDDALDSETSLVLTWRLEK